MFSLGDTSLGCTNSRQCQLYASLAVSDSRRAYNDTSLGLTDSCPLTGTPAVYSGLVSWLADTSPCSPDWCWTGQGKEPHDEADGEAPAETWMVIISESLTSLGPSRWRWSLCCEHSGGVGLVYGYETRVGVSAPVST